MKCSVCGKEVVLLKVGKLRFHQCNKCFYIKKIKPDISDTKLAKELELYSFTLDNKGYQELYTNNILKVIEQLVDRNITCLDYSYNNSMLLPSMLTEKYTVHTANKFFKKSTLYKEHRYDVITCINVFERIKDPIKELHELLEVLKKGGFIVCYTHHYSHVEELNEWWSLKEPTHRSFYQRETIDFICRMLNLTLIYHDNNATFVIQK